MKNHHCKTILAYIYMRANSILSWKTINRIFHFSWTSRCFMDWRIYFKGYATRFWRQATFIIEREELKLKVVVYFSEDLYM